MYAKSAIFDWCHLQYMQQAWNSEKGMPVILLHVPLNCKSAPWGLTYLYRTSIVCVCVSE